ncbi:MAG TPA: hypothetical protein PKY87_00480 [Terricaulis sp.]|nr:hypothetical protein [Terricaulis sp.]
MFSDRLRNIAAQITRIAEKPVVRRKLRRGGIVAAIALGGVLGLDYIITGGPDWNPGVDEAPRFELVASASAAETRFAAPPAPYELIARDAEDAALEEIAQAEPLYAHDPSVSADDLLGAPRFAEEFEVNVELASLLDGLKPASETRLDLLLPTLSWR